MTHIDAKTAAVTLLAAAAFGPASSGTADPAVEAARAFQTGSDVRVESVSHSASSIEDALRDLGLPSRFRAHTDDCRLPEDPALKYGKCGTQIPEVPGFERKYPSAAPVETAAEKDTKHQE